MNLWNAKDLPQPPINTYKAANNKIDIKHLYDVFQEGTAFFNDNKFMYVEYAVLSRIVYRMKQKFRSAKDFKALEKINKALDNYFRMDIPRNLRNFMELIPSRYKQVTYLPTKNLLDYILVRLQGSVKLMERIIETCKIAAYLLDKRMHTGHFWKIAFITFSIISRIYILAKYTAKFVCEFYSKLIPFSSQLNNTSGWSPQYEFPKDLKEWLNVDWLKVDDEIQIIEMPTEIPDIVHQFLDLVDDDDDVQFCDEYFLIEDDEDEKAKRNLKKIGNMNFKNLWELRGFDTREDVGEVIEINDSIQILDENSFPEKLFNDKDDSKPSLKQNDCKMNILRNTDKHDATISDDSIQFEGEISNMDDDRYVSNFKSQQGNPKTFTKTEEKTVTITIPDTPLVDRKEEKMKNKNGRNKIETNEDILIISDNSVQFEDNNTGSDEGEELQQENSKPFTVTKDETINVTIPVTPLGVKKRKRISNNIRKLKRENNEDKLKSVIDRSVIESGEDTVISLPDIPLREMIDEKTVKMKKCKMKRLEQDGGVTMQSNSSSVITDVTLVENSFSKKLFKRNHDIKQIGSQKNILGGTNKQNLTNSNNSVEFEKNNIDSITIPDTPLVVKDEHKFEPNINMDRSVIGSSEDVVILLPDTSSFRDMIDDKPVKMKKRKTEKQDGSINILDNLVQYGDNIIDTISVPDTPLMVKKLKRIRNKINNKLRKLKRKKNEDKLKSDINRSVIRSGKDNSVQYGDSIIDTIIVPDTPLVVKNEKSMKNEIGKLKIEKSEYKFKPDTTFDGNNIEICEDTDISLSSTPLKETIGDKQVKTKKRKAKKRKQNGSDTAQSNSSFINTEYKQPMKKKKKVVKSNQNESELRPNTRFNGINTQYGGKLNKKSRLYENFKANLNRGNDSFIQNKKPLGQTTRLPRSKMEEHKVNTSGQVSNLNNTVGQQMTGMQSTRTSSSSPRKRKLATDSEDVAVKRLKKAISKTEKSKKILEKKLSQTKWNLKNLSSQLSGEISPIKENEGIDTSKIVRSNKKRLQKKKPMRTEIDSHSNTSKIKPEIPTGLKSNTFSEHTQQNTKPINKSPMVRTRGRKKKEKQMQNNLK